jgi:hypothetical protein
MKSAGENLDPIFDARLSSWPNNKPAIHALPPARQQDVDARDKRRQARA